MLDEYSFKIIDGSHIFEENRNGGELFTGYDGFEVSPIVVDQQITLFLASTAIEFKLEDSKPFLVLQ